MKPRTDFTIRMADAAADVLHRLHMAGGSVTRTGAGRLAYDAPAEAEADVAELLRLKAHCLDLLELVDSFTPTLVLSRMTTTSPPADLARDVRARLLRHARLLGYPALTLPARKAERVGPGRVAWRAFCRSAFAADVRSLDTVTRTEAA